MELSSKYYIPTVEEFGIGFKYEKVVDGKGWESFSYTGTSEESISKLKELVSTCSIRVKKLEKYDIEYRKFKELYLPYDEIPFAEKMGRVFHRKDKYHYYIQATNGCLFNIMIYRKFPIDSPKSKEGYEVIYKGIARNGFELDRVFEKVGIFPKTGFVEENLEGKGTSLAAPKWDGDASIKIPDKLEWMLKNK